MNEINYLVAKDIIEQQFEKEIHKMIDLLRSLGLDEVEVKKKINEYIDKMIQDRFEEVNGELIEKVNR